MKTIHLHQFISREDQGKYLLVPFEMPERIEKVGIHYDYQSHQEEIQSLDKGQFLAIEKINTVDIGLIAPNGEQVGTSGSGYRQILVSETAATFGYQPTSLTPGIWQIMLGAYIIAPQGVEVNLTISFTPKNRRWLRGDPHLHSQNSDGILSLEHLGRHAKAHGLDFLAVTDHNQTIQRASFPKIDGLTFIPGQEWTHYRGHSNFLGIEKPYHGSFFTNSDEESYEKFAEARTNGALIVINHPLESRFGFRLDLDKTAYDLVEVWNGPMRPRNLETIAWWHEMLKAGKKQIAICGSDYHGDTIFERLANPCLNVLAWSSSESDILYAVRNGHSYFTYSPTPLHAEMWVKKQEIENDLLDLEEVTDESNLNNENLATFGETVDWIEGLKVLLKVQSLEADDQVRLIDQDNSHTVFTTPTKGNLVMEIPILKSGFIRLEIWRDFHPMTSIMPALVSNPIWFD